VFFSFIYPPWGFGTSLAKLSYLIKAGLSTEKSTFKSKKVLYNFTATLDRALRFAAAANNPLTIKKPEQEKIRLAGTPNKNSKNRG